MTSTRFSSRTAAGTLAGLMGASLLLPALTAKAAPLEFDCYSRTSQELLVKAAYDMSNSGMACLKSSTAAATPADPATSETASASAAGPALTGPDASLPADPAAADSASATSPEAGRAPGLGAVIVGGIVNSLMDKLLNRLLPGSTGEAAAVDAAVIDPGAMDPGMAAVEVAPQPQQAGGSRPTLNFGALLNKTSIVPGLVKQTQAQPMPRPLRPSWFGTRPVFTRPSFSRPNFSAVNTSGLTKLSNLGSKAGSTPLPNFSALRTLR